MKKTFLILLAAIVATAFLAADCGGTEEKTPEEYLFGAKKGWELYTATTIPSYTNAAGVTSEDLFVSFFYECEVDDILYFYENKSSVMNYGKEICEGDDGKDISLGNWRVIKENNVLEFHLPYFFDANDNFALLEGKIVKLDEETLQLRIPITFVDDEVAKSITGKTVNTVVNTRGMKGAKGDEEYDFTLTYRAK